MIDVSNFGFMNSDAKLLFEDKKHVQLSFSEYDKCYMKKLLIKNERFVYYLKSDKSLILLKHSRRLYISFSLLGILSKLVFIAL